MLLLHLSSSVPVAAICALLFLHRIPTASVCALAVEIESDETNLIVRAGDIIVKNPVNALDTALLVTISSMQQAIVQMNQTIIQQQKTIVQQQQQIAGMNDARMYPPRDWQTINQVSAIHESIVWAVGALCSPQVKNLLNISTFPPILFPSSRAVRILHFVISGRDYIAISNQQNTSSNRVVDSVIFFFDGHVMTPIQHILTRGNYDMDYITINGASFIVIAAYLDTRLTLNASSPYRGTNSDVWRWDPVSQQFLLYQSIEVNGGWAEGAKFVTLNDIPHLIIGGAPIMIFRWSNETMLFESLQNLTTLTISRPNASGYYRTTVVGLYRVGFSEFGGRAFLALTSPGTGVHVCEYDFATGLFEKLLTIPSVSPRDAQFAIVGASFFLSVANNDATTPVFIYRWDGVGFQSFQNLSVFYTRGLKSFSFGGRSYLSVASESSPGSSMVYYWDGAQYSPLNSFSSWPYYSYGTEFFSIGSRHFLGFAASQGADRMYDTKSALFEWNGCTFA